MTNPITLPPDLVKQWLEEAVPDPTYDAYFAARAAQWGADQELEACIKLLSDLGGNGEMIRRYRRPQ